VFFVDKVIKVGLNLFNGDPAGWEVKITADHLDRVEIRSN
jgi:hypothetical protein